MKILKRILFVLIALIITAIAGSFAYLNYLKPTTTGILALPDLKDEVTVKYDSYGIPHIYATNEEDLFYAFGYVHAQDRLFQMEVLRRLAGGRLSAIFGRDALKVDLFFRTLSLNEAAKKTIANRNPEAPESKAAAAYVKGINQFQKMGKTPLEFTLAGITKEDFTIEDVEMIVGYMNYTFVDAMRTEAITTFIHNAYGENYLKDVSEIWPDSSGRAAVGSRNPAQLKAAKALASMADALQEMDKELAFPPYHGSNGWAIAGSKTKSGKPILSNDTHIAFSQPATWYEAHLSCPTFEVYGNFLAGTPLPALGHSMNGGWGLTMFENDDADFYREKINPANANEVMYKGQYEPMEVRSELIKIKGESDTTIEVKKTKHGYIMNLGFQDMDYGSEPLALKWVFHDFPSPHMSIFYKLCKAKNTTEAEDAVKDLSSSGLNFVWADSEGNIAWWAAGKLPIRPKGVNPILILDGSTGDDDWLGYEPWANNPKNINPAKGYLWTANNLPENTGIGDIPGYYVPNNRARRIEHLLSVDKNDWTESDVRAIIDDVTSDTYPEQVSNILAQVDKKQLNPAAGIMFNMLSKWDGSHELTDTEPTMYYKLLYRIFELALKDELGPQFFPLFVNIHSMKRNTTAFLNNDESPWWDNIKTKNIETRAGAFTKALNLAALDLTAQLGENPKDWQWSRVHTLEHKHPMGMVKGLDKLFNVGPYPMPGGRETINNMDFPLDSLGNYKVAYGPALRRIVDFGNPGKAYSVLPTGQSGYFFSSHYSDQAALYNKGGKRPELLDAKEIDADAKGILLLKPL